MYVCDILKSLGLYYDLYISEFKIYDELWSVKR